MQLIFLFSYSDLFSMLRGNYKKWSKNALEAAIRRVHGRELSVFAASKAYSVPRSTLQRRLHSGLDEAKPGPDTVLTAEEEDHIVEWIVDNAKRGFGQTRDEILNVSTSKIPPQNKQTNLGGGGTSILKVTGTCRWTQGMILRSSILAQGILWPSCGHQ